MPTIIRYILPFLFLLLSVKGVGQVFPVQVNANLLPPYTPYLSDYTAPGAQKLMLRISANDLALTDYRAKLRITIEGVNISITTRQGFVPQQPIVIEGADPKIIYGDELAEYFNPNALVFSGITRGQYQQGARLPEGVYRLSVEVLDYNRGTLVSNKSTAMAWIILNDPPLLNLPRNGTKTRIIDPTNIVFTWTPRHTGSPNSAFSTEYVFRMVEVWPANRNPFDAFLTQPPLQEVTTAQTQIIYGPGEPALIPGRKYAWQVQARDQDSRDLFKNQGRSEVFVFQFGDAVAAPENVQQEGKSHTRLNLKWDPPAQGEMPQSYRLRFRKAGTDTWYGQSTAQRWAAIPALKAATTYEVQVRSEAGKLLSEYTPPLTLRTEEQSDAPYVCGAPPSSKPAQGVAPLPKLTAGDEITCRNFRFQVTEADGANGTFSGKGYVQVPFFNMAGVRVEFKGIQVNDKYELVAGDIVTTYKPGSGMDKIIKEAEDIGENKPPPDTTRKAPTIRQIKVPTEKIDTIVVVPSTDPTKPGAEILVTGEDGSVHKYQQPENSRGEKQPVIIVDNAGNTYLVEKDGKVSNAGSTGGATTVAASVNYSVEFDKAPGQNYGFDKLLYSPQHEDNYDKFLKDAKTFFVPWKSVAVGSTDRVRAVASEKRKDLSKELVFRSDYGPQLRQPGATDGEATVTVLGRVHGQVEEVTAYFTRKGSDGKEEEVAAGKLNVVSYDKLVQHLVVVSVNGTPVGIGSGALRDQLNDIFAPAAVEWTVQAQSIDKVDYDRNGTAGVDDGSSGSWSNYTPEMRTIIKAYKAKHDLVSNTWYLFFVPRSESGNTLGFMPRKKQAGFTFTDQLGGASLAKVIAHEVAHGAFRLNHTFPLLGKSTTDNLMDYRPAGTELHKYQWKLIHDPEAVLGLFEGDEEGAMVGDLASEPVGGYEDFTIESVEYTLCFTPAGKIFALNKDCKLDFTNNSTVPVQAGTLVGFECDGIKYSAKYRKNKDGEWYFRGYFKEGTEEGRPRYSMLTQEQLEALVSKEGNVNIQTTSLASLGFAMVIPVETAKLAAWLEALSLEGLGVIRTVGGVAKKSAVYLAGYMVLKLFATGSHFEYGEGTVVLELPFPAIAISNKWELTDGIPKTLPITAPVTIDHKIPNDKGDCSVYVIFRIDKITGEISIGKYGMTCQTNPDGTQCDDRPDSQCRVFNTDPDPFYNNTQLTYKWSWIPFARNISNATARIVEKSLTGSYILVNAGALPPLHQRPCFKRVTDFSDIEQVGERLNRVQQWINEMKKLYGSN
jgi:TANFOR domain-containing protein